MSNAPHIHLRKGLYAMLALLFMYIPIGAQANHICVSPEAVVQNARDANAPDTLSLMAVEDRELVLRINRYLADAAPEAPSSIKYILVKHSMLTELMDVIYVIGVDSNACVSIAGMTPWNALQKVMAGEGV